MAGALPRSPLAPERLPDLAPIAGVRLAAAACGLKKTGAPDVLFVALDPGTSAAGVYTRSRCPSAPVDWCRRALPKGSARAVVVNAGNANAFTGQAGVATVAATVVAAAKQVGCDWEEVFVASTGVIGQPLPEDRIARHLPDLAQALGEDWAAAAEAIRTTDTFAKGATRTATIGGTAVTLTGIAKGSGMIAPDMATMLSFVFTDATIPAPLLQKALAAAVEQSFNAITVDGDTSTSDTLMLFATGQAGNPVPGGNGDLADFQRALNDLTADLARQVACDGEGAQKLITIAVKGAISDRSARRIGLAIANSPLLKTAVAGEDANWGRIVMAVGKSGEPADRDKLGIAIGGVQVARDGMVVAGYDEAPVAAHMKTRSIGIEVDIGIGRGHATVWTCDLTHGYISINADYRS
ncbi:bifunctional glutamate N-acetyltransferase/amino-acid acetyltransferase ArgJ [Mycobacterium sp. KBS0706]|uniref:bifunctional glutamate N-acetyltransferase/amino-acid acetyltransferase ArgJ n=1 Tax=Mycobacterium sp. KBS0706 TaxID=2578109 RepID=UPI00110FD49A|nr:bifunctional glutamate N-acetyltransferase/amino-acid acetyltransferase ArgJ [Mycobacterium sp. KBS0706]TSD87799.1 bifunctional glutamate N-acetyltransferase/amino-acid acetyltransferase ArgJ [Mycobacterium sp. KBS0706]